MINKKLPKVWYGGDYNPDQWSRATWDEDMRLFKLANIDVVTVPVFSWTELQPEEERYEFGWLDELLDRVAANGMYVVMATSTAARPAWMARRYPDILRVDFEGRKHKFGGRHNACPNSPTYRKYAPRLAEKLAERYKNHPALVAWHINNEYGGYCYCENCAAAFRVWLQKRYGTLEKVNEVWNTRFWSHVLLDWEEIVPPNALSEWWAPNKCDFQAIQLDYNRFQSESLMDACRLEYEAIKRHTPDVQVTTNFMDRYKDLDYFRWAKHLDVVSWDSYPQRGAAWWDVAFRHDLMRGLKGGQPFMLMEQTPSQVNWAEYCALKRPGEMRLQSFQAVARGADTVMFFQLRQSQAGHEKFHGAVISHAGHEQTRVFREVAELGRELVNLGDALVGARAEARVAILFDWENWWAMELSAGPNKDWQYMPQVEKYYRALSKVNIPVDIISPEMDLSRYDVVIAPSAYMMHPGWPERAEAFVAAGGTFVTTFMSGMVDENDRVFLGGYPGALRKLLGIWVEEFDGLFPDQRNGLAIGHGSLAGTHELGLICTVVHSEGAEVIGEYAEDFYVGTPALTCNHVGKGQAWYIAADPEQAFVDRWVQHLCAEKGVQPLMVAPECVEVTQRVKEGRHFTFVLNHGVRPAEVDLGAAGRPDLLTGRHLAGKVTVGARDLLILGE